MIYFMFYDRRLSKRYVKRLARIRSRQVQTKDSEALSKLREEDKQAFLNANLLCKLADTHIYQNTSADYFSMGEKLFAAMLNDLKNAENKNSKEKY